jgi:hypothetical protein
VPSIALKIIPKPEPGTRPVVFRKSGRMVFFQGEERAPALSCGHCGHTLVTGIPLKRFTTVEKSPGGKAFKDGEELITGTLSVKGKGDFAGNTQLVIKCPACSAYNETVASRTA